MKPSQWEQLGLSSAANSDPDEEAIWRGWMCEKFFLVRRREKNVS
jgi:hypothetical protein